MDLDNNENIYVQIENTNTVVKFGNAIVSNVLTITNNETIVAYPNPFSKQFILQLNANHIPAVVTTFDIFGNMISTSKLSDLTNEMDLSSLNSGIYFCVITSEKQTKTIKILKQ
ncbi:MAG: T9SS type A sorting domain-containing protein [Bacteroidetes bacterium]|nr:T9SS type A sorting domain-containing protein [Bacteroidota bacterium]